MFGGPKNYSYKSVNARTPERKTVCKVRGITLCYAAAQLVNFGSIRDMILGTDVRDAISVGTDKMMKHKMRKCDGSGLAVADTIAIVSEQEVLYRVSFHKRR